MKRKKILRITTADISLNSLLRGQLRFLNQYYDVVGVASDTGVLNAVGEREDIRVIDIPMHREISLKTDIVSLWRLYRLFRKERPDILHANTPKGSLLAMVAGMLAGVPRRIYLVTGLRYQGAQGKFRYLLKTMERLSCRFATNVIPEGQGVLHILQKDGITNKPLRVLHYGNINGIDTQYYDIEATVIDKELANWASRKFTFVFVGRIVRDKGIEELVACMRQLDCQLILVGTFEKDNAVSKSTQEFLETSQKVKFVGWQEDVRPFLAVANALVFPSYREGFPNAPMQAGAFNLPSIVTDINGCNEIIKDGLNGKIIQAPLNEKGAYVNDITQPLEQTMRWFLTHQEEVKRMGKNARRMIVERYEQKDVWQALLDYYNAL
ncbi:glycosyltransferase family 4 protein [Prevotella sp. HUN102]|uniref:glycosyltransferase family 4 protein n=1 Tax=Prevotella sp. HUN102 TaxID=1392486 RepID=UPI00048CA796|nr:glycosyltransferase family 4 protein [Prevotella sp. HUN102]